MCPGSLGVEHQFRKLEVLGSIPSLGLFVYNTFSTMKKVLYVLVIYL